MLRLSDNPPIRPNNAESITAFQGNWMVAHTKARNEKALAWELNKKNINYFLPMVEHQTFSGGRKRNGMAVLLPSYVFFCGDELDRYTALATNRICQVIPVNDTQQFINELAAIETALNSQVKLNLYSFAQVGQRCRVTNGPMMGVEGSIIKDDDVTRLVLQVSMLHVGVSLEIHADFLEPVDEVVKL